MRETELGEKLSWGAGGKWCREGLRDGVRERLCPPPLVGRECGKIRLSACSRGLFYENLFQGCVCCVLISKSLTMNHDLKKRA